MNRNEKLLRSKLTSSVRINYRVTGSRDRALSNPRRSKGNTRRRKYPRADRRHFRPRVAVAEGEKKNGTDASVRTGACRSVRRGWEKSYIASASGVTSQTHRRHMNNIAAYSRRFRVARPFDAARLDGVSADWIRIGKDSRWLRHAGKCRNCDLPRYTAWRKSQLN